MKIPRTFIASLALALSACAHQSRQCQPCSEDGPSLFVQPLGAAEGLEGHSDLEHRPPPITQQEAEEPMVFLVIQMALMVEGDLAIDFSKSRDCDGKLEDGRSCRMEILYELIGEIPRLTNPRRKLVCFQVEGAITRLKADGFDTTDLEEALSKVQTPDQDSGAHTQGESAV